jgi:hypothetical protein
MRPARTVTPLCIIPALAYLFCTTGCGPVVELPLADRVPTAVYDLSPQKAPHDLAELMAVEVGAGDEAFKEKHWDRAISHYERASALVDWVSPQQCPLTPGQLRRQIMVCQRQMRQETRES